MWRVCTCNYSTCDVKTGGLEVQSLSPIESQATQSAVSKRKGEKEGEKGKSRNEKRKKKKEEEMNGRGGKKPKWGGRGNPRRGLSTAVRVQ